MSAGLGSLAEFLRGRGVQRAYHSSINHPTDRSPETNGDWLIERGTRRLFDRLGIELVDGPGESDLITVKGGGGFHYRFDVVPASTRRLSRAHPSVPICLLPTSFHYPGASPVDAIGQHAAPFTAFCRERTSWNQLSCDPKVAGQWELGLDHDLAFELEGDPWLKSLPDDRAHVLIVERRDREHPIHDFDVQDRSPLWRARLKVPRIVKRVLFPVYRRLRSRFSSRFDRKCDELLAREHPEWRDMPRIVDDIAVSTLVSVEEFCSAISRSAVVFTMRLHVGILAALLGKPTYLFEGSFHKMRSIYDFSLASRPHVRLVSRQELLGEDQRREPR